MCHQTVGLVARTFELAGIPTTSLSSCRTITASVRPPRAAFVDFPLGHTAGRPFERDEQRAIVRGALSLLGTATEPGRIVDLPVTWAEDDSWKDTVLRPGGGGDGDGDGGDSRSGRRRQPVWQHDDDRLAAEARHADGPCGECVGAE